MTLLAAGYLGALAYVLFRYVAGGWIGYAIAGAVALAALIYARSIVSAKIGRCPRCDTPIEVDEVRDGYQCASCKTFLEHDRGQLLKTPPDRIATACRFRVEYDLQLVLPDVCCVCCAPATQRVPTKIRERVVDVPFCAEHTRGIAIDPKHYAVQFRSLDYATRVAEASGGQLVGLSRHGSDKSDRWLGFFLGLVMAGGAAGVYYGLAALEEDGYEIVPTGPKGLVLWICLKLLGRLWVTAILASLAAAFFGSFIASFKPRRQ
jgi:hypothetical protein